MIVREFNHSRAIHFHAHLLPQIDLNVAQFQGNCLRPRRMRRISGVVCHANRKSIVNAIFGELILARALEAVVLSVERFVVRIAVDRANSRIFHAFGTTLARDCHEFFIRSTFGRLRALDLGTADFAGAALAGAAGPIAPGFVILVYFALVVARAPDLGLAEATGATVERGHFLVFGGAFEHGAGVATTNGSAVMAGAF